MFGRSRRTGTLSAFAATVLGLACVQDDGTRFNPLDTITGEMSAEDERETGLEVDREIVAHFHVIVDPLVTGFVNELGARIARQIDPQPFVYRFRIVVAPSLNAFATSGGYVYLHSRTVMAASSVDELAGVVGHEIAHISARHYARLRKARRLPNLAAQAVAIGAAVAMQEPGIAFVGLGANQALQLRYSRELESEADELGGIYVARAGLDPSGSTAFFERLLDERDRLGIGSLPPYLYTHPELEERIAALRAAEPLLPVAGERDPSLDARFREVQARLGWLLSQERVRMPPAHFDPAVADPLLAEAALLEAGDRSAALAVLTRASSLAPDDPRVAYRIGELWLAAGRAEGAAAAFERAAELDPTRAATFYQLGLAYRAASDEARAVYAFDQALLRASAPGGVRDRAAWELSKLVFGVIREAGFAASTGEVPAREPCHGYPVDAEAMVFWGRVTPRFLDYADEIEVIWRDPAGVVVQERSPRMLGRVYLVSRLARGTEPFAAGTWTAVVLFQGAQVEAASVDVQEGTPACSDSTPEPNAPIGQGHNHSRTTTMGFRDRAKTQETSSARPAPAGPAPGEGTYLDQGCELTGELRFQAAVKIDGRVQGGIKAAGTVTVGESAVIEADVEAESVVIEGTVEGDIHARRKITLHKSARVTGQIKTAGIVVEEGARFKGSIVIGGDEPAAASPNPQPKPSPQQTAAQAAKI